jgi:uncharacterized protein
MSDITYENVDQFAISRAAFIRRTYAHVAGAVLAFAVLLALFMSIGPVKAGAMKLFSNRLGWLGILVLYMGAQWFTSKMAADFSSKNKQYLGLGLFVLIEAIIFTPLLSFAMNFGKGNVIPQAILLTSGLFLGLTAVVFLTKHSFSWLKTVVTVGTFVAIAAIVASAIFGFNMGTFFVIAMIVLMAASILYTTGQVNEEYPEWAYVAASLALFSALATLFWYVVQLVMSFSSDD